MMNNKDVFWKKISFIQFLLSIIILFTHTINNIQGKIEHDFIADSFMTFCHGFQGQAVQMFFMISSLLFFRDFNLSCLRNKYKNRIFSLVIPYITWNTIGMLFYGLIGGTPTLKQMTNTLLLPTWEFTDIIEGIFHYKFNIIFWFIYDLILLVIISPITYLFMKRKWTAILFIICMELLAFKWGEYFVGARCPESWYCYFISAYISIHHFKKTKYQFSKLNNYLLLFLGTFIIGILTFMPNIPIYIHMALGISASICFWFGCDNLLILHKKWMNGLSMFIFAIHFNISMIIV